MFFEGAISVTVGCNYGISIRYIVFSVFPFCVLQ
jgi:hypothetical protein